MIAEGQPVQHLRLWPHRGQRWHWWKRFAGPEMHLQSAWTVQHSISWQSGCAPQEPTSDTHSSELAQLSAHSLSPCHQSAPANDGSGLWAQSWSMYKDLTFSQENDPKSGCELSLEVYIRFWASLERTDISIPRWWIMAPLKFNCIPLELQLVEGLKGRMPRAFML